MITMFNQYLEIKVTKERGRGLFARCSIPKGTCVLQVEESQFITYELMVEHPLFYGLDYLSKGKVAKFAFFLAYIQHKQRRFGSNSAIKKYIDNLPRYYHNLIGWSDKQLQSLGNRKLFEYIMDKKAKVAAIYQEVSCCLLKRIQKSGQPAQMIQRQPTCNIKRGSRRKIALRMLSHHSQQQQDIDILRAITLEDVIRFVSVIQSRNIYYPTTHDYHSEVGALNIALQMFNHSVNSQCLVQTSQGKYQIILAKDVVKGQQLLVTYGQLSVEKQLQFYGMVSRHEAQQPSRAQQEAKAQEMDLIESQRQDLIAKYQRSILNRSIEQKQVGERIILYQN